MRPSSSPDHSDRRLQHSRYWRIVIAGVLLILLISRYRKLHDLWSRHVAIQVADAEDNPILNSTLGVGKSECERTSGKT